MDKVKQYILDNYNKYGIEWANGDEWTRADMNALLNILEAHGETLDSMHDAVINGDSEFCYIWFSRGYADSDSYMVNALFEYNVFIPRDEFADFMVNEYENAVECGFDSFNDYFEFEDIHETSDGYVNILHY